MTDPLRPERTTGEEPAWVIALLRRVEQLDRTVSTAKSRWVDHAVKILLAASTATLLMLWRHEVEIRVLQEQHSNGETHVTAALGRIEAGQQRIDERLRAIESRVK